MVTVRKLVLVALDLASTVLTLMTGLRENPLLVLTSGRYDLIRSRFKQRKINYNIIRDDLIDASKLTDLETVGSSYRFISAPRRSPENLAEDRSTCMRVNSMNTSILTLNYDDFFGRGARREQLFLYSISAPHCEVINVKPEWVDDCIRDCGGPSECYEHILDQFDALLQDRLVQVGVPQDFGTPGRPFLKCIGRPQQPFQYITDLMVHQSYWAGGDYHVEVQSSRCIAQPLVRNRDWKWGLFAVEPVDQAANVVIAIRQTTWIAELVSHVYGVASLVLICRGIFVSFSLSHLVRYIPRSARRKLFSSFVLPLVGLELYILPPARRSNIVIARGERLMASDLWMNHWLYIFLSILDAVLTIRTTYTMLEMGTWMLSKKVNFENFLFICTALTKLTWILCFVHSVLRFAVKTALSLAKSLSWFTNSYLYGFLRWHVDAVALFVSYKLYSVLLCTFLYMLLILNGKTTLMKHQHQHKQPNYGGNPDLANFWSSEIFCDLTVICSVMIGTGYVIGSLLLATKYRALTHNRLLKLMQDRFIFVGWDLFVVIEALGMDPLNPALVKDGVALTNCSFAALLQQLYTSGPSGLVNLAGDDFFLYHSSHTGSNDTRSESLGILWFPLDTALSMGLYKSNQRRKSARAMSWRDAKSTPVLSFDDEFEPQSLEPIVNDAARNTAFAKVHPRTDSSIDDQHRPRHFRSSEAALHSVRIMSRQQLPYRFADRLLRIHAESPWGKIVFVDFQNAPGELVRAANDSMLEFVVKDALTFLKPHEIKDFFGYERQLRIA